MINKINLIKLAGEDNIFYDSEERLYRYRMHCDVCGKVSGCRCFDTLEKAECASESGLDYVCSYKCVVIGHTDWDDVFEVMRGMGLRWWLKSWILRIGLKFNKVWISENDAYNIIDEMDIEFDGIGGESC